MILIRPNLQKPNLVLFFDLQTDIFQGIIHFLTENYSSILRRTHKMIQQHANIVRLMYVFVLAHSFKIHFSPQAAGN